MIESDAIDLIFRADFTAGGLTLKRPCVYLLVLKRGSESWHYIGRTGTSNNTGISAPYKRLAKHLVKTGNTQSAIWDAQCLSADFLDNATVSFVALSLKEDEVKQAECWLIWHFQDDRILNKVIIGKDEPKISEDLRSRLTKAFITSKNQ